MFMVKFPYWSVLNYADSLCIKISLIFYMTNLNANLTGLTMPHYGSYPDVYDLINLTCSTLIELTYYSQNMKKIVSNVDLQRSSICCINVLRSMQTVIKRRRCRRGTTGLSNEKCKPAFKTCHMPTCIQYIFFIYSFRRNSLLQQIIQNRPGKY